jgi:hypothetical protein
MIVLVRCTDDTYSVAMESCIEELGRAGLINAYLSEGEWVKVSRELQVVRHTGERYRTPQMVVAAAA